jgi:exopolyphosphatase/pppGpp-phosphohydrolase
MKDKNLFHGFSSAQKNELKSVLNVAKQCNYEPKHTRQVTKFALEIFDDLEDLHKMGWQELYTCCAPPCCTTSVCIRKGTTPIIKLP